MACSTKLTFITQLSGPKQILPCVRFPSARFLNFFLRPFHSASGHHQTYRVRFPWPARLIYKLTLITQLCGPKQILTWVHFPSAWFLKFYWRSFRSASGHQHIGFVSLGLLDQTDSHHSALWTQTNFDLGSLFRSLVSQILLVFVSLSPWTPTYI